MVQQHLTELLTHTTTKEYLMYRPEAKHYVSETTALAIAKRNARDIKRADKRKAMVRAGIEDMLEARDIKKMEEELSNGYT